MTKRGFSAISRGSTSINNLCSKRRSNVTIRNSSRSWLRYLLAKSPSWTHHRKPWERATRLRPLSSKQRAYTSISVKLSWKESREKIRKLPRRSSLWSLIWIRTASRETSHNMRPSRAILHEWKRKNCHSMQESMVPCHQWMKPFRDKVPRPCPEVKVPVCISQAPQLIITLRCMAITPPWPTSV